jgi:phage terminase small subunit
MSTPKATKDMERAQAAFHKKEMQQRDGVKAMAEYRAAGDATRIKTEKLRALRLAKEEADKKAAETKAAAPKTVKAAGKAKKKK